MATIDKIQLLDSGYIQLIDHMGSDEQIVRAARQSTDKGFLGWGSGGVPGDEKLLSYLYKNRHDTPFEMADVIVEVKAPIFVFREWHRHRTQSYNEMSARYTPIPDESYMPSIDRVLEVSGHGTKQARGTGAVLTHEHALTWLEALREVYDHAEMVYKLGLSLGVPKELARLCVPVARYSKMWAKANLRNWLAFCTLRNAPNAQKEIRVYAQAMSEVILPHLFPQTMALFAEGR